MPSFNKLPHEYQLKVRQLEQFSNELGKDSEEARQLHRELGRSQLACFALKQRDGAYSVCTRDPAEEGKTRCSWHGGKSLKGEERTDGQRAAESNLTAGNFIHGGVLLDKDKTSQWLESLTDAEIAFMVNLENKIRASYEVPDDGLSEVILSGLITDAVLHFRLLRTGRYDKGSRHTVRPINDIIKTAKEMGWLRKADKDDTKNNRKLVNDWLDKLE